MVLTVVKEDQAVQDGKALVKRTQQEKAKSPEEMRVIIELVMTVIDYKYPNTLSTQEICAMLDISFQESRFFKEARQEGRQKGRQEGLQEGQVNLIVRQMTRRFGALDKDISDSIANLPASDLTELGEAFIDFSDAAEVKNWLQSRR